MSESRDPVEMCKFRCQLDFRYEFKVTLVTFLSISRAVWPILAKHGSSCTKCARSIDFSSIKLQIHSFLHALLTALYGQMVVHVCVLHKFTCWYCDRMTEPGSPVLVRGTPLPPLSIYILIFSPLLFPFFHWLYLFSSFVHPFPFYQNSPTPFPGRRS